MKTLPTKKQFKEGEIVSYSHPSKLMVRAFGRRVFHATSEAFTLQEQYNDMPDLDGRPSDYIPASPPEEGNGMVLCSCFEPKHGNGTWYYKILLGEQLYWIASEHLSTKIKE